MCLFLLVENLWRKSAERAFQFFEIILVLTVAFLEKLSNAVPATP